MPAPATVEELLDLVQKSGVADEARLKAYMQKLTEQKAIPPDPTKLAGQLVRDGLLTYFQAEQLLQGKWKRFSIGKYKVLERIGSGGMGQVFLCEHKLMRRRVAVKVLPVAKLSEDQSSLARFYREARAVAAVDHPNIVRAYDIDQDDNLHFLVMEFVDGTNLNDLVKKVGPLDPIRACHYIYGAAVGLQHAHEIGLVHRDIKPGNILVDRSGVVKLLDLGLARFFHDEEDNLTKRYDENVLGTADYLSPEQALDSHTVDIRADIYSLGATFYYLLTGSAPFPEGSVAQKLIWHQSREPRPIKALRPEVPDEMVAVVQKMMAKDPAKRYSIPADVMTALLPWVSIPISPPAESELPQLSPAVMAAPASMAGVRPGGAPGPSRAVGAPPTIVGDLPTLPVTGMSPRSGPPTPLPVPIAQAQPRPTNEVPVASEPLGHDPWAAIDTDVSSASPTATSESPSRSGRRAPRSGRGLSPIQPRRSPLPWILLTVLVLAGGGVGAYFAFFHKPAENKPDDGGEKPPPPTGPRRIEVKRGEPSDAKRTPLDDALQSAKAGDVIVLVDEQYDEPRPLAPKAANITLESGLPAGKRPVIRFAPLKSVERVAFFQVTVAAEGLKVRNIVLDGGRTTTGMTADGKAPIDVGVILTQLCPGVTFENVTVQNVRSTGFRLNQVSGRPGSPVTLDGCTVAGLDPNGIAGFLLVSPETVDTRQVVIRNCRVDGPGKAGIRVEGPTADVELTGNRLDKTEAGIAFVLARWPAKDRMVQALVSGNRVTGAKAGILIETPAPPVPSDKFELRITQNHFGATAAAGVWAGGNQIPGLTPQDNKLHDNTPAGSLNLAATPTPGPVP